MDRPDPTATRRRARGALWTLSLIAAALPAAGQAPAPTPAPPDDAEATPVDTIVVVGTKRPQARQQATQSVQVLTERDTVGLQSALDAAGRVPNIARQSAGFLPTVRGLDGNGVATGGGGAVTGANPRMSNYVDGVARTYGATPDGAGSVWDLAQIEVYRGAQSTLLGQNALAGAIVQTTRDPVFADEYALQAGVHDARATFSGAYMANKALGDAAAIRIAGETVTGRTAIDYGGFTGTGLDASDRDDLGRLRYGRHRLKALLAPTDAVTVKLTLEQERRRNAYTQDLASLSPRREVTDASYGWFDSDTRVAALNLQADLGPSWTFDAVLSRQTAFTTFGPPIVGQPDPAAFLDFSFDSTETALEPRLVWRAPQGRSAAVVGAFARQRERTDLGRPGSLFALTADDRTRSRAVFADATLQLAEAWDLLAAVRVADDRQQRDFSAFGGALAYAFDEQRRAVLPKLGVTFHASPDAAFSLVAHQGDNPGGGGVSFVTFTPYRYGRERADTVELVARTRWPTHQLTLNANLFVTRLDGLQISAIGPAGPSDGIVVNIARARTRGLEADLAWRPDPRTRLALALGLLDTRIVDFGSAANAARNGNRLGLAPKATANLAASYELRPDLLLGGDIALMGGRYTDDRNLPEDRLPGHGLVNLNLQFRHGPFTVTGYVNNVFDKFVQWGRFTALNQAYVNDPRTVGVTVKGQF